MATYNWGYKPNIPNKYGIVINDTADDVPTNYLYVALFGNDDTGNGSRMYPYRTLAKALTLSLNVVIASGVYREGVTLFDSVVGDGDVVLDGAFVTEQTLFGNVVYQGLVRNLKIRNWGRLSGNSQPNFYVDCIFENIVSPFNYTQSGATFPWCDNCIFKNCGAMQLVGRYPNTLKNTTFVDCVDMTVYLSDVSSSIYAINSIVFKRCNIWVRGRTSISHSLFYECNMLFAPSRDVIPNTYYPTTPAEYTQIDDIETARNLQEAAYGVATTNLDACIVADPKFNGIDIGDYSLAFDSPAKNLNYFGTYAGALSIGYAIKAATTEADGDFDFSTNVNLTISDNSIVMSDPSLLASIESKVKPNLIGRELAQAPIFGFYADRNGQYIDTIADLSASTVNSAQPLSIDTPYIVEVGSIIYDGNVILAGERFTTTDETSFTTDSGGICREILEAPQRHTIMARFSDGGAIKIAGDALTTGYWYYAMGTLIYNGNTYTNEVFKATDTSPFTGSGQAREAMTDQVYQHYEPNVKFTSNNVGDMRTGAILRGNGDPDYERGVGKEFPINARFIQIKYILQPNNLKP